jgi:hypothetical protein
MYLRRQFYCRLSCPDSHVPPPLTLQLTEVVTSPLAFTCNWTLAYYFLILFLFAIVRRCWRHDALEIVESHAYMKCPHYPRSTDDSASQYSHLASRPSVRRMFMLKFEMLPFWGNMSSYAVIKNASSSGATKR